MPDMPALAARCRRGSASRSLGGSALAALALAVLPLVGLTGCRSTDAESREPLLAGPDYGRALPPGRSALRRVHDAARWPNLEVAWEATDQELLAALDRSLEWFAAPSSRRAFPHSGFTHEQMRLSVVELRRLLLESPDGRTFARTVQDRFELWESVGWDGRGSVLFTAYHAPEFRASRVRTAEFRFPLYRRPADLVTDPQSGRPLGRRTATGGVEPYPDRGAIERRGLLDGTELVWLASSLDAFLVHVNGSAKLRLADGSTLYVGYDGKTDQPYASLGAAMVREGLLQPGRTSLRGIRAAYTREPEQVRELMLENRSYVFFTEYAGNEWPSGSLGVPVTARASVATDKELFPRGGPVIVDTTTRGFSGRARPFVRFMLDQDTGGAIDAPGRADLFMGIGPAAELIAGQQFEEGRLCYLVLRPGIADEVSGTRIAGAR